MQNANWPGISGDSGWSLATTLASHVEYLRREMAENPGFEPGDVFLCNDPYVSVCHQTCVQVAAPIFHAVCEEDVQPTRVASGTYWHR